MSNHSRRIFAIIDVMVVFLCLFFALYRHQSKQKENITQEIVATTWGWSKIVSTPVPITTTNMSDYVSISQVKFGIGDGQINTALVNNFIFVCLKDWKVGDEVLITSVPGTFGDLPSPTFIVTDYRPQEQKK